MQTALRAMFVLTLATAVKKPLSYHYSLCSFESHDCDSSSTVCVVREGETYATSKEHGRYYCQCLVKPSIHMR